MEQIPETEKRESVHWHCMSVAEVIEKYDTNNKQGLTHSEIQERLSQYGPNALPDRKPKSSFTLFLKQFQSPLIYLLFVASAVAFFLKEVSDALVILVVVFINSIIGAVQEGKAEKSLESLRNLSKLMVKVKREGKEVQIESRELVPGDLLLLNAGDAIAADGRIIEARDLTVAEASLTGESVPVEKTSSDLSEDTILPDRTNMVYSGTFVATGRAKAIVVGTGEKTEFGKIAQLSESDKNIRTPLEEKVANFGKMLIYAAGIVFVLIVGVGTPKGLDFTEIFMVGVSQIVSMIPEGLPVAITVALAVGVRRMAYQKAFVRKLSAVETLGSTNIICTDKTGTLTKNEMTVKELILPSGEIVEVSGTGYLPEGEFTKKGETSWDDSDFKEMDRLLASGILCNDSTLTKKAENWEVLGDPTEGALLTVSGKRNLWKEELEEKFPRQNEIPFNSESKLMLTEHKINGEDVVFIKGAPERILNICHMNSDWEIRAEEMAKRALRVLAFAEFKGKITEEMKKGKFHDNVQFLGLMGQMDPPREEVHQAVKECWAAGIRPIMVTGDHKETGQAIGRMLGIVRNGDVAVDGRELEKMSDSDLETQIDHISVFARVHPEQKLRIIETLQKKKNVVAMTGDGINDAPALSRADVGVAMGITGTDTAKEATKIVITDDNFATIVQAVKQGRIVYRNVKKLIIYLFTTGLSEILILFTAILLGYPPPLAAVQILWINLVTDGALTVTLIMEPEEGDEMKHRPVSRSEPLLNRKMLQRMGILSPAITLSTLGYYVFNINQGRPFNEVQTETFTLLAVSQWFNAVNCRSDWQSVFQMKILRNKWLLGGLVLGAVLHTLVIYLPFLNNIFYTVPISWEHAIVITALASIVLWVEEIRKIFVRKERKNKNLQ